MKIRYFVIEIIIVFVVTPIILLQFIDFESNWSMVPLTMITVGVCSLVSSFFRIRHQIKDKSDLERLPGELSEFVMQVLDGADEQYERRYKLKALGYDSVKVEHKVLGLFGIAKEELYSGSRKKSISEARSVFCYWCVRELGESMTSIAKLLGLTQPAVGYAVDRGERISQKRQIPLIE